MNVEEARHHMKIPASIVAGITGLAAAALGSPAHAGSTFYFNANQTYTSAASSPFSSIAGSSLKIENFEDGLLNQPGVKANQGFVKGPGWGTDSVDSDSGPVDGFGRSGHSFSTGAKNSVRFNFKTVGGSLPSMAGLVFTDGPANSIITFKAWDAYGNLLGKIKATLGDLVNSGQTGEDRFFGVKSTTGISKIQIASNMGGIEIDHLQFAYGFAVVPIPPAVALGLVGLVGVMAFNKLKRRAARQTDPA
jgi:hypothetical protein